MRAYVSLWPKGEVGWGPRAVVRPAHVSTAFGLPSGAPPLVHRVGLGRLQLILPAEDPLAPSYNIYEGGGGWKMKTQPDLSFILFFFIWILRAHPWCRKIGREWGGVRKVPSLSVLFSAWYLDGCLSIIVSVSDFLCFLVIYFKLSSSS
jgi:hypothetical protein